MADLSKVTDAELLLELQERLGRVEAHPEPEQGTGAIIQGVDPVEVSGEPTR